MWHDDTLSQGSKEKKEQGRGGGWTKFEKGGGVSNIGGTFIKYGVKPSANLAVYELNSLQKTIF